MTIRIGITNSIKYIAYLLISILPKKRIAVLRGFPDYEDNLLAVYKALTANNFHTLVWVVDNDKNCVPIEIQRNTIIVKRGSLKDIFYSSISKYLFITHGHFLQRVPKNQICVNLWHGIPFKRIGKMQGENGRSDTFLISTSEFTQKIFEQSFDTAKENILITGQPRTDRMLRADVEKIYSRIFSDKPAPKYLFVWLPTFRSTNYLNKNQDGKDFGNVFNCSDFSISQFNAILRQHNAYCIVKPHPMAISQGCNDESNIFFVNEDWLIKHKTSLYEFIGAADCLISDISSVIADFMLLDRPIVLLFEDIEEYKNNRGFSLNPITSYLPADVSCNFEDFIIQIQQVLSGQDIYYERRNTLKNLFFKYSDSNATSRVCNAILRD